MPNWTSNEVRFKSRINSKRQLSKLKKRLKGVEYLVELASGEKTKEWNDFDFNKIHKMPKALENTVSPTQDGDEKKAEQRLKKYGAKNWYDWNCKNWGTKWNSVDTEIIEDEKNGLTYTFSYDEINNLLTITNSNPTVKNTTFNFTTTTSCRRFLGFSSNSFTINSTAGITSDRAVDITDTRNSIFIRLPNLSNQKVIESSTKRYSNIVAHIPVPLSRNTIFTYEPSKPFCMELNQRTISAIDIAITFQNEEQSVHFGKGDWELNLLIEYKLNMEKTAPPHTIHRQLIKQMKNYEMKQKKDNDNIDEIKKLIKSLK